jgi:hypothetical protein
MRPLAVESAPYFAADNRPSVQLYLSPEELNRARPSLSHDRRLSQSEQTGVQNLFP